MIIGYNYLDLHGYVYGVQNQVYYLQTKYSNIYYAIVEIDILYSPAELKGLYEADEIAGLYCVIEITQLYSAELMSE